MSKRRGSKQLVVRAKKNKLGLAKAAFRHAMPYAANFVPYGPQIYRGAQLARSAYQGIKKIVSKKQRTTKRRDPKGSGVSTGTYAGKFKKPGKVKESVLVRTKGVQFNNETWGHVADPDCVYVGHSTYNSALMTNVIVGALLRQLFRKAGFEIGSPREELPLFANANSDGFKIVYVRKSALDGSYLETDYITVNNQSFMSVLEAVCGVGAMFANVRDYLNNTGTNTMPHRLALYASDRNVADTNWRLVALMNLENVKMTITSNSVLTLQNRTAGETAAAGDLSADRVDNQPMQGKIYNFKHADPRFRANTLSGTGLAQPDTTFLSRMAITGLDIIRSAQINVAASNIDFQEPPPAHCWNNIEGVVNVKLQPGSMKKTMIGHVYSGYLPSLMNKLRVAQTSGLYFSGAPGRSQIVALEEVLRTASTNNLFLNYEREMNLGAYCVEKKKKASWPSVVGTLAANNVPP